jgi:acetolactate synthase I/II/III large subunit
MMRIYEAIVKGLKGVGVEAALGGAGENAASLLLALTHSETIRPIITHHEQAASFMACGYAMYTDRLGFCFATAGPEAFNLFSGLAVAMSDSYPVLAISGYASLEWKGKASLNETSGVNTPCSRPQPKKSSLLTDVADTCDVLEGGRQPGIRGTTGPSAHSRSGEPHPPRGVGRELSQHPSAREAGASRPAACQRGRRRAPRWHAQEEEGPCVAGFGAIRSRAGGVIKDFIERFHIPLITTLDGKGIVAEQHPLVIGVFADSAPRRRGCWRESRRPFSSASCEAATVPWRDA